MKKIFIVDSDMYHNIFQAKEVVKAAVLFVCGNLNRVWKNSKIIFGSIVLPSKVDF